MIDKFGVEIDVQIKGLLEEEAVLMGSISRLITQESQESQGHSSFNATQARLQIIRDKINQLILTKEKPSNN